MVKRDKRAKKRRRKLGPAKSRDPFWRLRRLLGVRCKAGLKTYRRTESKKQEREAERVGRSTPHALP